jgi:hypothetical protein
VVSRGTKPCANRVATARRLAASCRQRRQRALGACCRRMKARLGTPKALTATAPKLARLIYTMLKPGTAYVRQRRADDTQHDRDRKECRIDAAAHSTNGCRKNFGPRRRQCPQAFFPLRSVTGAIPAYFCSAAAEA